MNRLIEIKKIKFACITFILISFSGCSPADQEDCRVDAARGAKNTEALKILLEDCEIRFPARRAEGGGYEYLGLPVAGPSPTEEEMKAAREQEVLEEAIPTDSAFDYEK